MINLPDAAASCAEAADAAASTGGQSSAACTPTRQRDFTTEIAPLFAVCSGEVCHAFTAAGLRSTIGLPSQECCVPRSLVAPGAPEQSYLLDKLRGERLCAGVRMPIDRPPLGDGDVQAISDWICEGAPISP